MGRGDAVNKAGWLAPSAKELEDSAAEEYFVTGREAPLDEVGALKWLPTLLPKCD